MSTIDSFENWLDTELSPKRAILAYGVLILYYLVLLFPIFYLISASFKVNSAITSSSLSIIPTPSTFTLDHYLTVLTRQKFQAYFVNSTIIGLSTTALTLLVSIIAGYSLSRFEFPGHDYMIVGFISSQMMPYVLILIPFYFTLYSLGLVDTYIGIILAQSVITIPFSIWLLKGFFDDIPESLDEAAIMDGCSRIGVLVRVILPLSLPGVSVAAFYTFVGSWNDFLFVSMLSQTQHTRTLPFGLYLFQTANTVNWGAVLAAAVITMVPVIVLFALVQKYIIEGLASGGMKGF